ncbi:hypothetical protein HY837_01035 [archaeon]|nr:hypothetical protein [archaeon]
MSEVPELLYVLKVVDHKTMQTWFGGYILMPDQNAFPQWTAATIMQGVSSIEELVKNLVTSPYGSRVRNISTTKRAFFPDVYNCPENLKTVFTFHDLNECETKKFIEYFQKALNGEPIKKRHNPEITQEDLQKAEVKE